MSEITIKTPAEIVKLRKGGRILAGILKKVAEIARPGVKAIELDSLARKLIKEAGSPREAGGEAGATPSFEGFGQPPYPAVLCVSVNEGLVHCVPGERELKSGDVVGLDLGIWYEGLCTDMAITVGVGKISGEAKKLIKVTKKSLDIAISQVRPENTLGDIGYAVQSYVEKNSFSVIRKLVGHGVGYQVHEPPQIPNFGSKGHGEVLKEGMVLALEPMVAVGHHDIEVLDNQWDIVMRDKSLSAHFEHTVAVTENGCEILTRLR